MIGFSTDPYGSSHPRGFGVATALTAGRLRSVKEREPRTPIEVTWLGRGLVLVRDNVFLKGSPAALFAFRGGRLERLAAPPLRPDEDTFAWSPNRRLIATQPWLRGDCEPTTLPSRCGFMSGRTIFVVRSDGSNRRRVASGLLRGWTPDGRVLLFTGTNAEVSSGAFLTLDVRSGRKRTVLSSRQVAALTHRHAELGDLAYSADGRYLAAQVVVFGPGSFSRSGVVIARANGRIVRLISSRDTISMFAWSPRGHRLVYTTSGFPAPHELYLLASPRARQWRILSQAPHFDWVTWSPDGRWLLIDNEHEHAWELLHLTGHRQARLLGGASVPGRRLPRLGGMPLWCCPQQSFGGA
jgi:dipeptidyl aminopeptidase/acylaminoacyl peptidase